MYTLFTERKGAVQLEDRVAAVLAESWATRVAVKTSTLDVQSYYDASLPDFPPELVPFCDDPRSIQLDAATRRRLLAAAWVAYNEKTIDVETHIVTPACQLLLRGAFAGPETAAFKRIIVQTQVDEQFHILMCLEACLLARRMHGIEQLAVPQSLVVRSLQQALAGAGRREAEIIQLGYAMVAEVTINGYLNLLANNRNIQPFNRETTALHRKDESSHHRIFRELARSIYSHLSGEEQAILTRALTSGLNAFVAADMNAWCSILEFLDIPEADDILQQCCRHGSAKPVVRDYSGFRSLLGELGIPESRIDFAFGPVEQAPVQSNPALDEPR